ncbi:MAG: outer membrane protein assembly factor BamD [Betaproteobacteria bacterium]|nr:outer membrane protein assembly factor BamD [Betaproteobacteria bacterium]
MSDSVLPRLTHSLRLLLSVAALALAALLTSACSGLDTKADETVGWSATKLYGEAKEAIGSRDWTKAIKYLEKLEARYPFGRYAQQAQLDIAYCYYKDNERASAVAAADRFIKLHPNHPHADYAYYLKGLVNFNEDAGIFSRFSDQDMTERDPKGARDAFAAFRDLVTRFPDSKYAPDAAARMKYLVNALAQNEVHVARYYMKRKGFVAAANRAQFVVQNYPQAPAVEEAVFVMVKAYDALGLVELRDGADKVMRTNFPQSKYLSGKNLKDVPWWRLWDPNW